MESIKENSLWYRSDINTHYYVLHVSEIDTTYSVSSSPEFEPKYIAVCIWLGNGDISYIPLDKLGALIDTYTEYNENIINRLINPNIITGTVDRY